MLITNQERKLFAKHLETPTKPVVSFDSTVKDYLNIMHRYMVYAKGVGLAANQIGLSYRMCVIQEKPGAPVYKLINPQIIKRSVETEKDFEGCLSLPRKVYNVERAKEVTIVYQDITTAFKHLTASGMLARIIQHEIDHLDGITIHERSEECSCIH
jgi:peptide deformylase